MPRRTNRFQTLIATIESSLATPDTEVIESALVMDANGTEREIDILIKATVDGRPFSIAVECRLHSRCQDIGWIDSLIGKYVDIPVDRIFAVSGTTFTKAALTKAAAHNIQTLNVKEALAHDWPNEFILFHSRYTRIHLRSIEVKVEFDDGTSNGSTEELLSAGVRNGRSESVAPFLNNIRAHVSRFFPRIQRFIEENPSSDVVEPNKDFTFEFGVDYCDCTLILQTGEEKALKSASVRLECYYEVRYGDDRRFVYNGNQIVSTEIDALDRTIEATILQVPGDLETPVRVVRTRQKLKSNP